MVVDDLVGAEFAEPAVVGRARGGHHLRNEVTGELNSEVSDATRGGRHQYALRPQQPGLQHCR